MCVYVLPPLYMPAQNPTVDSGIDQKEVRQGYWTAFNDILIS